MDLQWLATFYGFLLQKQRFQSRAEANFCQCCFQSLHNRIRNFKNITEQQDKKQLLTKEDPLLCQDFHNHYEHAKKAISF